MVDPRVDAVAAAEAVQIEAVQIESVQIESVQIVVNGEARQVPDGHPLPDLITDLGLRVGSVVVEYNGDALTSAEGRAVRLRAGDRLELVRAVAGG